MYTAFKIVQRLGYDEVVEDIPVYSMHHLLLVLSFQINDTKLLTLY